DGDRVAVLEAAHVELTNGRAAIRSVRNAVDDQAAHAADAFAAIGVEGDRIFALLDQPFVDDVEHLEKGHVRRDMVGGVIDELPARVWSSLAPDSQVEFHL